MALPILCYLSINFGSKGFDHLLPSSTKHNGTLNEFREEGGEWLEPLVLSNTGRATEQFNPARGMEETGVPLMKPIQ